ncbi:MAG: hypothetical protein WCX31_04455 [Salinivirgaceae bacterium]
MQVIRVIQKEQSTEMLKTTYPREDKEPIVGLDASIEFYEIQTMPYPGDYDPNKHTISEIWTLTTNQGEFLKVCLIEWLLTEKPQAEVLVNFNNSFGNFIDTAYPIWKRVKDFSQPTNEGTLRQAQETSLREERQLREDAYINSNIFPDFNFNWL